MFNANPAEQYVYGTYLIILQYFKMINCYVDPVNQGPKQLYNVAGLSNQLNPTLAAGQPLIYNQPITTMPNLAEQQPLPQQIQAPARY